MIPEQDRRISIYTRTNQHAVDIVHIPTGIRLTSGWKTGSTLLTQWEMLAKIERAVERDGLDK